MARSILLEQRSERLDRISGQYVVGTMALSVLLVQTPALATLLHLKPLHRDDWLLAVGAGLLAALLSAASSIRRAPGRTERERVRTETTEI